MHTFMPDTQHIHVASGYDVVLVRQHVRQMARESGFTLPLQARMTAVVSEIARMALDHHWNADFTFRRITHRGYNEIEVLCRSDCMRRDQESVAGLLHDVQALIGDGTLVVNQHIGQLTIRFHA
ncbi:ATP-binding protein [Roseiflexus castenholzii]|jgi:hypothetical protein|uniref:Putative anti-sigma regulatory factor, serine/threonine protein kinase n=1 Tax=Roseiflexus castenholzii (strain DSM 13941 / HLO8) TaxID=383372 RepID=A7NNV8_ROSCS|nr:anti-sigma regulatory factor [Roseiflexus castenholzii]ABU59252.1 putative anti-sigma regulatory factor, serine/threonine protein kinase [Roseiflexus castenholzii DSM 13941]